MADALSTIGKDHILHKCSALFLTLNLSFTGKQLVIHRTRRISLNNKSGSKPPKNVI